MIHCIGSYRDECKNSPYTKNCQFYKGGLLKKELFVDQYRHLQAGRLETCAGVPNLACFIVLREK